MADFSELVRVIYDDFLKRDLLGKIAPGYVAGLVALHWCGQDTAALKTLVSPEWLLGVLSIPVAYVAGVALQLTGERLGLHSASPRPRFLLLIPTRGRWKQANTDFDDRLAAIRAASPTEWPVSAEKQRERFLVLKEACGNMALALVVLAAYLERVAELSRKI